MRGGSEDGGGICQLSNCHNFTHEGLTQSIDDVKAILPDIPNSVLSGDYTQCHLSAQWLGPNRCDMT